MAAPLVGESLRELGFIPSVRLNKDTTYYTTDEGNLILDCSGLLIEEPAVMARRLDSIVGIVEHGLFLGMASLAIIAGENKITERSS